MSDALFDIKELEDFADELEKAAKEAPVEHKKFLGRVGYRAMDNIAKEAPDAPFRPKKGPPKNPDKYAQYNKYKSQVDIKSSFQRRSYYKGKPQWVHQINGDNVVFGSKAFYARWVNDGHNWKVTKLVAKMLAERYSRRKGWVAARVSKRKERKVVAEGFVPGLHFIEKGLERTSAELPGMVEKHLQKIMGATFNE